MGGTVTMRKTIILLSLLSVCLTFSSCTEMMALYFFFYYNPNEQEIYDFIVDNTLVKADTIYNEDSTYWIKADTISIEYVGNKIPQNITDKKTIYYSESIHKFAEKDTVLRINIKKKVYKHKDLHFYDNAICADTIRLYRNDTLLKVWEKSIVDSYHTPYNKDEWIFYQQRLGCKLGPVQYLFYIREEDIEKWKNGE